MVQKTSAGILMYRMNMGKLTVFLCHHGGPEWEGKDTGAWDIPKGEADNGESETNELRKVAIREFHEETGIEADGKKLIELGSFVNKRGKTIHIWAFEGKGNEKFNGSNLFEMEWPRESGKIEKFPEMDKGQYFEIKTARIKAHSYASVFFDRLEKYLGENRQQEKLI